MILIANSCTRWRGIFKGFSQEWGQTDFSKNFRASLFKNDPSYIDWYVFQPDQSRWLVPLKELFSPLLICAKCVRIWIAQDAASPISLPYSSCYIMHAPFSDHGWSWMKFILILAPPPFGPKGGDTRACGGGGGGTQFWRRDKHSGTLCLL